MSQQGLLDKLVTNLADKITTRGLTAYFLIDDLGGGTKRANTKNVTAQHAIADDLRAAGVTIGDITDALTQTYDDRGVLITWTGDPWFRKKAVYTKLQFAIQIRWIVAIKDVFAAGDIEDFDLVQEETIKDEGDTIEVQVWKRIKVRV